MRRKVREMSVVIHVVFDSSTIDCYSHLLKIYTSKKINKIYHLTQIENKNKDFIAFYKLHKILKNICLKFSVMFISIIKNFFIQSA